MQAQQDVREIDGWYWRAAAAALCVGLVLAVATGPLIAWTLDARADAVVFDAAQPCPAAVTESSACVLTAAATVLDGATESGGIGGPGSTTAKTSFTLSSPAIPGGTVDESIGGDRADTLPPGAPAQVEVWRGKVVGFTVLGTAHRPYVNPDERLMWVGRILGVTAGPTFLTGRAFVWLFLGRRRRRWRQRAVDGVLILLVIASYALVVAGPKATTALVGTTGAVAGLVIVSGVLSLPSMVRGAWEQDAKLGRPVRRGAVPTGRPG